MTEVPSTLLFNFFFFLLIPFIFGYFAKNIKINPVVGYLLGGLVLGNIFKGIISQEILSNFAYFGIVLLLFTVGLEINFDQILRLKKFIIIGGILQILLSIFFIFLISFLFKFSFIASFLIGIALSSSSTALVAKIIQDRGEESTLVGEIALGIIMFQDLAFIPFLIIFNSIKANSTSFLIIIKDVILAVLSASLIILLLFYFGQKIVPFIFDKIARTSRELLNLFIILFIFFVTYLSTILHIPILIGVFTAGILVSQTLEHYHIFSQIRPFRDLLSVIFFVFIGLNIKFDLIIPFLPKIFIFTFLVVLIKALIVLLLFIFFRFHSKTAFSLSLFLFQIDEDAFILMLTGFNNKIINYQEFVFINFSILLTLILTPILIKNRETIYSWLRQSIKKFFPFLEDFIRYQIDRDLSPIDVLGLKNHVVICGYGRVGGVVGQMLTMMNIPFIAIDYNFQTVEKARKQGINIIYGDPTDIEILDYAEVDNASILISAVPEKFAQETIILNARKLNPKIFIICRVHQKIDSNHLKNFGVDLIVRPEFEASLSILRKVFLAFKIPKEKILAAIKKLKLDYGIS